jgi:glycosyltransferase involved in cell wall biosynthesis
VLAPDLPVVREHFGAGEGWVPFRADDVDSLAQALQSLTDSGRFASLCQGCLKHRVLTWGERSATLLEFLESL